MPASSYSSPIRSRVKNYSSRHDQQPPPRAQPKPIVGDLPSRPGDVQSFFVAPPRMELIQTTPNIWLESSLQRMSPNREYLNVSIRIHYLTPSGGRPYQVYLGKEGDQYYLIDYERKKVTYNRAIFIVSTAGHMYIARDRTDSAAPKFPSSGGTTSVICHISFKNTDRNNQDQVLFAGIITVDNGRVQLLSNETGTYLTSIVQTLKAKDILEYMLQIPSPIEMDLILQKSSFLDEMQAVLQYGKYELISNMVNNLMQQDPVEYREMGENILQLVQSKKDEEDQKRQPKGLAECCICMKNQKDTVILPCLHMSTCDACSRALMHCPICRCVIQQKITALIQ